MSQKGTSQRNLSLVKFSPHFSDSQCLMGVEFRLWLQGLAHSVCVAPVNRGSYLKKKTFFSDRNHKYLFHCV